MLYALQSKRDVPSLTWARGKEICQTTQVCFIINIFGVVHRREQYCHLNHLVLLHIYSEPDTKQTRTKAVDIWIQRGQQWNCETCGMASADSAIVGRFGSRVSPDKTPALLQDAKVKADWTHRPAHHKYIRALLSSSPVADIDSRDTTKRHSPWISQNFASSLALNFRLSPRYALLLQPEPPM